MKESKHNKPSLKDLETLLEVLKNRFEKHMNRHLGIQWNDVLARIQSHPNTWHTLAEMERTGGEPDVIGHDKISGAFLFCDCAAESPVARRSLCYDANALEERKENKPQGNVLDLAKQIGIELLNESQYRHLQQLGTFDLKTSSWIQTPDSIRQLGGALFCDRRYNTVFVYHNGASSYYAARGFRGICSV